MKVLVTQSCQILCDPWTVARQGPLSVEFSRQEYWSGLPFPTPGDLPCPQIEPGSPALQADSSPFESPGKYALRQQAATLVHSMTVGIQIDWNKDSEENILK